MGRTDKKGLSLFELIISMSMLAIIAGASTAYFVSGMNVVAKGRVHAELNQQATQALSWLERDIREASLVVIANASQLKLSTPAGAVIQYDYVNKKLTRTSSGNSEVLLTDLDTSATPFFSYRSKITALTNNPLTADDKTNLALITIRFSATKKGSTLTTRSSVHWGL